jgi:hypothetical protein
LRAGRARRAELALLQLPRRFAQLGRRRVQA